MCCPVLTFTALWVTSQGTVFGKWYAADEDRSLSFADTRGEAPTPLPSDQDAAFMYRYAVGYLRSKGFEHYEVSSYALLDSTKSWRSRHNQVYWAVDSEWYALGLGATSYVDGVLTARPRTMVDYIRWVQEGTEESSEKSDNVDLLMDTVLKRLRTSEGLSLTWIRHRFPDQAEAYIKAILEGSKLGLELGLASLEQNILRLKDPSGFLFSNSIISAIFAEIEDLEEKEIC